MLGQLFIAITVEQKNGKNSMSQRHITKTLFLRSLLLLLVSFNKPFLNLGHRHIACVTDIWQSFAPSVKVFYSLLLGSRDNLSNKKKAMKEL